MTNYLRFFKYAFDGLKYAITNHRSFLLQSIAGIAVMMAGLFLSITQTEWLIIIVSSGMVLTAELFNTSAESILDYMEKKHDLNVRIAKDVAAGGVLVAAMISIIVGAIIFVPYILTMLT